MALEIRNSKLEILNQRGFTLIEIMITIGIFAMLATLGLFLSMDVWRGTSVQNEQDVVLALLYKARSRSLANINEQPHGFYIDDSGTERRYWVFEGSSFDPGNPGSAHDFVMAETITFSGNKEIVFSAREARLPGKMSFTMGGQGRERTFTINEEGGITWE